MSTKAFHDPRLGALSAAEVISSTASQYYRLLGAVRAHAAAIDELTKLEPLRQLSHLEAIFDAYPAARDLHERVRDLERLLRELDWPAEIEFAESHAERVEMLAEGLAGDLHEELQENLRDLRQALHAG